MLPRLEAEESLDAAARVAAGLGRDGRRLTDLWLRAAGLAPVQKATAAEFEQRVTDMGFGVHVVERGAPAGE